MYVYTKTCSVGLAGSSGAGGLINKLVTFADNVTV